jgi:RNase P protein component
LRLIALDVPTDVVIRVRPDAYGATFAALTSDIERAVAQLVRWRASVPESSVTVTPSVPASPSSDT